MKKLKILNSYCGIGGNRKLLGDKHEITAIELNPEIAKIYQDFFPKDKVIVADAHEYLLKHFEEFDFIWSSPPCQSHSNPAFVGTYSQKGKMLYRPKYPDMKLYEEILLLKHYFKGKWVVENVIGFYKPLIPPYKIAKHYFWANFFINDYDSGNRLHDATLEELQIRKGFDLTKYNIPRRTTLRNCVEPEVGLHIFNEAFRKQKTLIK